MRVQSLGLEDPLEEGMKPIPVFSPGESHGQRSLADYSPWGHRELDTTVELSTHTCTDLRAAIRGQPPPGYGIWLLA